MQEGALESSMKILFELWTDPPFQLWYFAAYSIFMPKVCVCVTKFFPNALPKFHGYILFILFILFIPFILFKKNKKDSRNIQKICIYSSGTDSTWALMSS